MSKVASMHACMQLKIFCECLHGADRRHDTMSKVASMYTCMQLKIFCDVQCPADIGSAPVHNVQWTLVMNRPKRSEDGVERR